MKRCLLAAVAPALLLLTGSPGEALQAKKPNEAFLTPEKAGPDFLVQGEYEGTLDGKDKFAAQVIARGDGKFIAYLLPGGLPGAGWDGKTRTKLEGKTEEGKTTLAGNGWTAAIADGKLTGKNADGKPLALTHLIRKSPTLDAKPPEGAVILFNGSSADEWRDGKLVEEKLLKMGVTTKKTFKDVTLHLEFRTPFMPYAGGQGRGNSGVYMQGKHEVQVLDSFGLDGKPDECGGIYGQKAPSVNMCLPPLSWQTYDIDYKPARLDAEGKKVSPAVITVKHNGVIVHDKLEIKGSGDKPGDDKPGPIHLQNHGNPVYYRNIWLVETK